MIVRLVAAAAVLIAMLTSAFDAAACDFCAATSPTICEELAPAEVIVTARVVAIRSAAVRYEILDVLRGGKALSQIRHIDLAGASEAKIGAMRLLTGCGAPKLTWSESHQLTQRSRAYVRRAMALPAGGERLAFFHDYLEDAEELIAQDAYNEFATASYADVKKLRGRMDRKRLTKRLADPKTPANRRGLLYTMLGICGTPDDVPHLEDLVRRGSRENRGSFDAIVAAYLSLHGDAGLALVDALFLAGDKTSSRPGDLADSHATIRALRFHLEQQHGVSKARILQSLRLLLDRPELASVVIADLARHEDWQALPRLVELFKAADADASGLRVQVVNYLLACPLPEAGKQLEELARIAPKDVERARILNVYRNGNRK